MWHNGEVLLIQEKSRPDVNSSLRTSFSFKKKACLKHYMSSNLKAPSIANASPRPVLQTVFTKNVSSNNQAFVWSGRRGGGGNIAREGNVFCHICPHEGKHVVVFVHTYLLGQLTLPYPHGTSPPTEPVPTC